MKVVSLNVWVTYITHTLNDTCVVYSVVKSYIEFIDLRAHKRFLNDPRYVSGGANKQHQQITDKSSA